MSPPARCHPRSRVSPQSPDTARLTHSKLSAGSNGPGVGLTVGDTCESCEALDVPVPAQPCPGPAHSCGTRPRHVQPADVAAAPLTAQLEGASSRCTQ